jgi:outer membrane protein assembly factor BamE (lipoprotein component of BamABCDE complex)
MKHFILIASTAIALAGCASVGNEQIRSENQESIDSKLIKGKTTKAQVRSLLGAADDTSFTDGGNEIWKYRHLVRTAKAVNFVPIVNLFAAGADQDKKEIVVLFDKNGVVTNYTFSQTKGEVRQGIFAK